MGTWLGAYLAYSVRTAPGASAVLRILLFSDITEIVTFHHLAVIITIKTFRNLKRSYIKMNKYWRQNSFRQIYDRDAK